MTTDRPAPPVPPMPFAALRTEQSFTFDVDAPPAAVFPLLCPVREREWIPGWEAEIVYSASGLVEEDCVFTSTHPLLGPAVYAVTRYEPAARIAFAIFYAGRAVQKLEIALTPLGGGRTGLTWERRFVALSPEGNALLAQLGEPALAAQARTIPEALRRACAGGGPRA